MGVLEMTKALQGVDRLQALTKTYVFTESGLFVSRWCFGYDYSLTVKPGDMIRSRGEEGWRVEVASINQATEKVTFRDTTPPAGFENVTWQTTVEDLAIKIRLGEVQHRAA